MFKKGDKVYSILRGWGEVSGASDLSISVDFDEVKMSYTIDGKFFASDKYPELYHTEPVITVPKRRVEHTEWIAIANVKNDDGKRVTSYIYENENELELAYKKTNRFTIQQITYYTEE